MAEYEKALTRIIKASKNIKERWNLAIQAIIMAGGEGVRLRPLTSHLPKPLCPLLGEPVMGYALKLLKAHGVTEIGATLWYQPQKIRRAFRKGEEYGVRLRYFEEREPLGTAGSVKLAKKQLTDTFFVLSGDGLTDCDLTAALQFHRQKKALATLVLKRVSVPLPYGVVLTDGDSRVTRFIEKPDWKKVFSNLVNTGVYILEPDIFDYIPDAGTPDFGKDIFPALLSGGLPVYGYETEGYWCDVGDQKAYLQAQMDLLSGKVALPHAEGISKTAQVHGSAKIEGLCWVGEKAVIGPGAYLRDAVIGPGAYAGPGAVIERSCLWEDAVVQDKARVQGSVLCDGASVRAGAEIPDGCALGQRAVAGAYATLRPGVKIWPHFRAAPGAVVDQSIVSGDWNAPEWTDRGAVCETAECACGLCAAFVKVSGASRIMTGCGGSSSMEAIAAGALSAAGARVQSGGKMTRPMLGALIRALRLDGGVYANGQLLLFLDRNGFPLPAKQTAAMNACVSRQEAPPAFSLPGSISRFQGGEEVYLAQTLPPDSFTPLFAPVAVFSDSEFLCRLAQEGLRRMGVRDVRTGRLNEAQLKNGETGFLLPGDGESVTAFTLNRALSPEQKTLLLLALFYQRTGKLFDLPGVPRAANGIAPLGLPDESRECAALRALLSDGMAALFLLADGLRQGPLELLTRGLPETHILTRDIPCAPKDKGRVLHALCTGTALPRVLGEGVRISHENGCATIVPDAHKSLVRVMSEAASSEFAEELCHLYAEKIKSLIQ